MKDWYNNGEPPIGEKIGDFIDTAIAITSFIVVVLVLIATAGFCCYIGFLLLVKVLGWLLP